MAAASSLAAAGSMAAAQSRIARLAAMTPVHRAFHWLHLHQQQMQQWQMEMTAIPAPPFAEERRCAWFLERFAELGLRQVHRDAMGNALAELGGEGAEGPCILLSAHLDTVFPAGTDCTPSVSEQRLRAPGICDNATGLTGLLALAAALRFAGIEPAATILFAANVGEEGEGDLRGMRYLFETGAYGERIVAAIALEGGGTNAVVTQALGSKRFRLTVRGPGGHSWSDAGVPNPILVLGRMLGELAGIALPETPRTTLNVGMISGGTSINSIPESAQALLDLRSVDTAQIEQIERQVRAICQARAGCEVMLETIGDRPAAALPADASLLHTVRAVDRHLGLRTEPRIGSTDANLPLSRGIPAIAVGAGGVGGGIHTLAEWYEPSGREIALRRILLTLLDTVEGFGGQQQEQLIHSAV